MTLVKWLHLSRRHLIKEPHFSSLWILLSKYIHNITYILSPFSSLSGLRFEFVCKGVIWTQRATNIKKHDDNDDQEHDEYNDFHDDSSCYVFVDVILCKLKYLHM